MLVRLCTLPAALLFLVVTCVETLQVTQMSLGFQRVFTIFSHHPAVKLASLPFPAAPELLLGNSCDTSADIYSFGVVVSRLWPFIA